MAMAGGGDGAFIGAIHRIASRMDGDVVLVAGAFQQDPVRARSFGEALGLPSYRSYPSVEALLVGEVALPHTERAEFIAITTPNDSHLSIAEAALRAGFHVLSEKPATLSLAEARQLSKTISETGRLYGLAHTYLGYPMVEEARQLVASGRLGTVHRVMVEYPQGWLAKHSVGNKQADWRTDPVRSGASGCFGDIGSHAHNLAEFVVSRRVTRLAARLRTVVPGRCLDDDGDAWFEMDGGIRGCLFASQVCAGQANGLAIRIFGDLAGLEWRQEDPNILTLHVADGPTEIWRGGTGMPRFAPDVDTLFRTPGGHPEGYLEAFANLYRRFAGEVRDWPSVGASRFDPGIGAALRGMAFIEASVASSAMDGVWQDLPQFDESADFAM